jgi:hypothetical protein
MTLSEQTKTLVVSTPNGAVEVRATEFDGDIVRGTGDWPGHPRPIRFWTTKVTWGRLCTSRGLLEAAQPLMTPPG